MSKNTLPENDRMLTVAQLADMWQISIKSARTMLDRGEIPAVRLPGSPLIRVRLRDAQAALEARETGSRYVPAKVVRSRR